MQNYADSCDNGLSNGMSGLIFRGIEGEGDYPLLLDINLSSRQADHDDTHVTLEQIAEAFAPADDFNPARDVLIAYLAGEHPIPVGYSRLGWYSSSADNRLYYQYSRLKQEYRGGGLWQALVRQAERRMDEIAAQHPPVPQRFYQAWTSDNEVDWAATLDACGYSVVRRFNNMLYMLGDAPNIPLPAGFEICPVETAHMHSIWEAQKEMNDGLFENVAEDWLEEKYPDWLADSSHTPQFWQVAWDGEQLAGMVLARIDEKENEERNRKRGVTEHIYVRKQWRGRGLASALIARSLQVLKAEGMREAELGVDAENESSAYQLYQRIGYKTFSVDTWYRKAMNLAA